MAYGRESGAINVAQADIARAIDALEAAKRILVEEARAFGWPAVDNSLNAVLNQLSIFTRKLEAAKLEAMGAGY